MLDLKKFCLDLFEDSRQPHAALYSGFLDHSTRFLAATDFPTTPTLGEMMKEAKTATGLLSDEARMAQKALNVAEREQLAASGDTVTARATAEKAVSRVNTLITAIVASAEQAHLRTLLFPYRVEQYTKARIGDLPTLLEGFLATLTANKAAFGALADSLVTDTETAFAAFTDTRTDHITEQGDTEKARATRRDLRTRLTNRLTENYHLLSLCYKEEPTQVLAYYTQRYFERRRIHNPAGERRRTIQTGQTQVLIDLDTYTDPERYRLVQVRLPEGGPVSLYRATDPRDPAPANAAVLPAGDALHQFLLMALAGSGPKLVVRNDSGHVVHIELALLEDDEA